MRQSSYTSVEGLVDHLDHRYYHYARLVIASFGLSRATDFNRVDLPAALARVSSVCYPQHSHG